MSKYRLINYATKEEHICDKVTIDGFDYYVSDEKYVVGENCIGEDEGGLRIHKCVILNNCLAIGCKKIIATNNPNIDISQIIDEVEILAENLIPNLLYKKYVKTGFVGGYNKSQETHPFSEKDMIEFANWVYEEPQYTKWSEGKISSEELFQLWKQQQSKTVYYDSI